MCLSFKSDIHLNLLSLFTYLFITISEKKSVESMLL